MHNKNRIAIEPGKFSIAIVIAMEIRKPEIDCSTNSTARSYWEIPVACSAGTPMSITGRVFSCTRPTLPGTTSSSEQIRVSQAPLPPPPSHLRRRMRVLTVPSPILAGHSSPLAAARVDKRPVFTKRSIGGFLTPMIWVKILSLERFRPRPEGKKSAG